MFRILYNFPELMQPYHGACATSCGGGTVPEDSDQCPDSEGSYHMLTGIYITLFIAPYRHCSSLAGIFSLYGWFPPPPPPAVICSLPCLGVLYWVRAGSLCSSPPWLDHFTSGNNNVDGCNHCSFPRSLPFKTARQARDRRSKRENSRF